MYFVTSVKGFKTSHLTNEDRDLFPDSSLADGATVFDPWAAGLAEADVIARRDHDLQLVGPAYGAKSHNLIFLSALANLALKIL